KVLPDCASKSDGVNHSFVHGRVGVGSLLGSPSRKRSGKIWYQIACLAHSGVRKMSASEMLPAYVFGSLTRLAPSERTNVYSKDIGVLPVALTSPRRAGEMGRGTWALQSENNGPSCSMCISVFSPPRSAIHTQPTSCANVR